VNNRRLLIAVVDDEECVRKALDRLLRSAGIDAETFPSGEDFLESLRTHQPDCVLLDLQMPRLTGFDVQTRLRESGARLPVIIITCQDSPAAHDRALNALTAQKKGDLRPAYNTYCSEVTKTDAAAGWTRTRVQWMGGDGRKYFQDWQKTIDGIANESLKKKAQKRMDAVREDYDKVEASLVLAGEKFKPFLSDLADIQKALATDVTAGGVKAIKSTASSANWNLQFVDKAVKSALKDMDKMQKALSSEAK
jgi:CheY-like chemotaxis protein